MLDTLIEEKLIIGFIRSGVLLKDLNLKRDLHSFKIKKLTCNNIMLLIVDY